MAQPVAGQIRQRHGQRRGRGQLLCRGLGPAGEEVLGPLRQELFIEVIPGLGTVAVEPRAELLAALRTRISEQRGEGFAPRFSNRWALEAPEASTRFARPGGSWIEFEIAPPGLGRCRG